jgi:hypothetical protein
MTVQVSDLCEFRGKAYAITARTGIGYFDPRAHGLDPSLRVVSTACYRGYQCKFVITNAGLELDELTIALDLQERMRVRRKQIPGFERGELVNGLFEPGPISGLALPVPFTGSMVFANGIVPEYIDYRRTLPGAYYHFDVLELMFEAGKVEKVHDRSTAMADLREQFGKTDIGSSARPSDFARYGDFIRRYSSCFSADYGLLDDLAQLARLIGPSATG